MHDNSTPKPAIDSLHIQNCRLQLAVLPHMDVAGVESLMRTAVLQALRDIRLYDADLTPGLELLFPKGEINLGALELSLPPLAQETSLPAEHHPVPS